jgi:4a-hydroxytetrahydrobiopterin dehydratase
MPTVLTPGEVDAAIAESGIGWRQEGGALVKVVTSADFAGSLAFVNAVGALAEEANHHPDIDIRWSTVTLRLSTHSAGGITSADLDLAGAIDHISS